MTPESCFGKNSPISKGKSASLEARDDGVAHVRDKDGHGGDGEEGPNDEEWLAGIAGRAEITVADGEEGDVAEVEGLEVAETLGMGFCFPEADGADAPKDADYQK